MTSTTYWRRPTVSSAQAISWLSGLIAISPTSKKSWPFAISLTFEQDFFRRACFVRAARVDRVFLAGLEAA